MVQKQNKFIEKANQRHNSFYDYSSVEYRSAKHKVKINCPVHGIFEQTPNNHLTGHGCNKCSKDKNRLHAKTTGKFIEDALKVHGKKYDYSKVCYRNAKIKIKIECIEHGMFEQSPLNHLSGQGCPKCDLKVRLWTTEKFIKVSNQIHNNLYLYNKTTFQHIHAKVIITCQIHGDFNQRPNDHINNRAGCPKCARKKVSRAELEWLDFMKIPNTKSNRQVQIDAGDKIYTVDGFIPETNTIYEFLGDFWHGNPEIYNKDDIHSVDKRVTYGDLYSKYQIKKSKLAEMGYKIIEIWESNWKRSK